MSSPIDDPDELVRTSFLDWWEGFAAIRGSDGTVVRQPVANELQRAVAEAIEWCEINSEPVRVLILKPRKEGATTIGAGKAYHLLRSSEAHCLCIGDESQTTQTMWDMLQTYQSEDEFCAWGNRAIAMTKDAKSGAKASWSHGATAWTDTAGDSRAGQSKTPTVILADEAAHWGKDGSANSSADTMLALLNSVRDVAGTYVIVSSTANGVGNWYYRTHRGAVTLAERKAGNKGNGWIKVFLPWHKSDWCHRPVTESERAEIDRSMTPAETKGCELYGWTYEQIAFRRHVVANKCDGDERKFDQEYPADEETCFLTSGRPVFDANGLHRIALLVAAAKPMHGGLETNIMGNRGFIFRRDENAGWLTVWEEPEPGLSYLATLDTMRGEQSAGAKDPDCHSFWVLRDAYIDRDGKQHPIRAVARLRHPCRWDAAIVAEKAVMVAKWYGECMIVPEVNQGLDVMEHLKALGANIYRRTKFDRINPGRTEQILGWETTSQTRSILVSAIIAAIREQVFDLECPNALKELRTFAYDRSGKPTAQSGCHDDDVISLGIGLANMAFTRRLRAPEIDTPHHSVAVQIGLHGAAGGFGGACE